MLVRQRSAKKRRMRAPSQVECAAPRRRPGLPRTPRSFLSAGPSPPRFWGLAAPRGATRGNRLNSSRLASVSNRTLDCLFFAVFWGCHCIWASASVRGHPREKHLVYVVGAGSRATHCKNAAANGLPLAEKTAKSHSKCHAIGFFGAVSSRSSHRSVGHRLPCGRRRSETTWWTSGPQDVGLCVVRVCGENAHRANRWQTAARNLGEKERALFNARDRFA